MYTWFFKGKDDYPARICLARIDFPDPLSPAKMLMPVIAFNFCCFALRCMYLSLIVRISTFGRFVSDRYCIMWKKLIPKIARISAILAMAVEMLWKKQCYKRRKTPKILMPISCYTNRSIFYACSTPLSSFSKNSLLVLDYQSQTKRFHVQKVKLPQLSIKLFIMILFLLETWIDLYQNMVVPRLTISHE